MERILDSIKFFLRIKFKKFAHKTKVIIFDCVNTSDLISILNYNEIFIMSSRIEKINTVYLSWNIILFMFKNIFKRRIKLNYFIALIEEIKPDLVITTVDNSVEFSLLSKYFFGKIKFLAIQFATRNDVYKNEKGNNKKLFFSNLICFSQFDLDLLKANGITVKNHFFAGSPSDLDKFVRRAVIDGVFKGKTVVRDFGKMECKHPHEFSIGYQYADGFIERHLRGTLK